MIEILQSVDGQEVEEQLRYIAQVQRRNDHVRRGKKDPTVYIDKVYYCEHRDEGGNPCNRLGTTRDHITPRSIAKRLGWTPQQIGSPENIQRLCCQHHNGRQGKDRDSEARKELLKDQLRGRVRMEYGDHKPWIRAYERLLYERRRKAS